MDAKTQQQYAETFHGLHRKGDPLILFNAWDVATAKAIAKASPAVATSSWAVASALGYADGEDVPLDMVTGLVARMTTAVSVPVSIDLEAEYGETPDAAARSVAKILQAGAIGINIEDGLSGGKRQLASPDQHAAKIKAVRDTAQKLGIRLFINARTDPFLLEFGSPDECLNEAAKRAKAYADAGADGIFVPGLTDLALIATSLRQRANAGCCVQGNRKTIRLLVLVAPAARAINKAQNIAKNTALERAIRAERDRRVLNGAAAQEAASRHFVLHFHVSSYVPPSPSLCWVRAWLLSWKIMPRGKRVAGPAPL